MGEPLPLGTGPPPAPRGRAVPEEAVILLAKAPVPGAVKTRLCPPLSPRAAASLHARMLRDTASELARLEEAAKYLFLAPFPLAGRLPSRPFRAFHVLPQAGGNLGRRMAAAFRVVAERGHRLAVLAGSDCPTLSARRVREAFRELQDGAFAVLGPADDGGFYLIGLSPPTPPPSLFNAVAWGGPGVLGAVLANLRDLALPFSLLPPERDVDTPQDLARLAAWARQHAAPPCPATRNWLRKWRGRPR